VESLLKAEAAAGDYLAVPFSAERLHEAVSHGGGGPGSAPTPVLDPQVGKRVGAYRLGELLGSGGMGAVYRAERADQQFEQEVAIKLLRGGSGSADVLRRFQNERQVLAGLQHPNIAQLLDGGATVEGAPYLVMEYVDGVPIDRYCEEKAASVVERLRLFRVVCEAVHYAHQNLVVHRDLKPSNILVRPDGVVKLLDFGIAKVIDPEQLQEATVTGMQMLTPRYASPEQIRNETITTASDVYTLGVVLYRLLTGHFPYSTEGASAGQLIQAICETQPTKPSEVVFTAVASSSTGSPSQPLASAQSLATTREGTPRRLSRKLAGDLDNILLKALRKEAGRRYASVEQLSDDIRRHLEGLPVRARPDTMRYRVSKFVRRNAPSVTIASVIVLALGLGAFVNAAAIGAVSVLFVALALIAVLSTWLYLRSEKAQRATERQRETSEKIAMLLMEALETVNPEMALGRDVSVLREILDKTAVRVDAELRDPGAIAGSLHFAIGSAYHSINLFDKSAHHLETALAIRLRVLEPSDLNIAETHRELGRLEHDRGDYPKAESLLRSALRVQEGATGDRTEIRAKILGSLAQTLDTLGQNEEAESFHREALDILRRTDGDATVQIIGALLNLGDFLTTRERTKEAREFLEEAVPLARDLGNPLLLTASLHQLGFHERWTGNLGESEALFRESLEVGRTFLPRDHPRVVTILHNLASLRQARGDFAGAEPLYQECLASQKRVLGPRHLDVGTTLNNLAGFYKESGEHEKSRELYEQAIDIYREAVPGHAWVAFALGNLASLLEETGRFAEAVPLAEESIQIMETHLAPEHRRIGEGKAVLGGCRLGLGRHADAETTLLEAERILQSQSAPQPQSFLDCLDRLASLYDSWGKPDRASQFRNRLAKIRNEGGSSA